MAKKEEPSVKTEQQKVQTKYDRKIEARKQQKLKDQKQERVLKIVGIVVLFAVVAAIAASVLISVVNKNRALNGTYVKIGDHELTRLEYDYHYDTAVNNYLVTYASILPYMGLDTSVDFAKQQYSDEMTWKDMFDRMTVSQIQQTKGMIDAAKAEGFTYDATEEYEAFSESVRESASSAGVTEADYYTQIFGEYATKENIKPFILEGMIASAYYDYLIEKETPTAEEVESYYNEHVMDYDKVDFKSFTFTTELTSESTEEEISAAMDEAKEKAEAMLAALKDGADFEQLCIDNASEDQKADYEDAETEYCLSEGRYYTGVTAVMADWLYADGRSAGDRAVLRDDIYNQYHVVEFISRYFDEDDKENISALIANERVSEIVYSFEDTYTVTDVAGDLTYLTLDLGSDEDAEE